MIILRTELKYYLPLKVYPLIRKALIPFTERDKHTPKGKIRYDVHSIYFDSLGLKHFLDKVEGEEEREKFRIRFYSEGDQEAVKTAWFELKQKRGPIIKKLRSELNQSEIENILKKGTSDPKLTSILQSVFTHNLVPMAKVSYKREALAGIYERDTRITFDFEIKGNYSPNYHTEKTFNQKYLLPPTHAILELKTSDQMPSWLSHIINRYNLELTSYSKYANAISKCGIDKKVTGRIYEC